MSDFIKRHKKAIIALSIVLVLIVLAFIIRGVNSNKPKEEKEPQQPQQEQQQQEVKEEEVTTQNSYQSSLSIKAKEEKKKKEEAEKRLSEKREEEKKKEEERKAEEHAKQAKPTYGDSVMIWGEDGVPDVMEDGKSIKSFLSNMSLSDVGSHWGTDLTLEDKLTENFYMVGVEQNENDHVVGVQLQSFGWFMDNISSIPDNSAIKFTDLNVVGNLADDHVALLCCYDWYSIWGLKDTMLVFEDISGTLKPEDFSEGKIFSAVAYKHNITVKNVNGYRVICVQYDTFK